MLDAKKLPASSLEVPAMVISFQPTAASVSNVEKPVWYLVPDGLSNTSINTGCISSLVQWELTCWTIVSFFGSRKAQKWQTENGERKM